MKERASAKYIIVMGLACFANYFGAGNLIFPPYLGLTSGTRWFSAFLFYIAVDAGLAVICLIAGARHPQGFEGVVSGLGKAAPAVLIANAVCLGPLIAVPRTGATTYSLTVEPLFGGVSSWIATFVFFLLVAIFCLKPSKVVDAIGSYMAPLLVAGLAVLIIRGIIVLNDPIVGTPGFAESSKAGLISGYQTMDMMGSGLFYSMLVISALNHNIADNDRMRSFSLAGIIAAFGLFVVYMGLSYLGARTTTIFSPDLTQAELLVSITELILGKAGKIILGLVVFFACLTTGIGLTSSCADTFEKMFHLDGSYRLIVIICCTFSYLFSNVGLTNIIKFASPVLELLYPVIIVCVAASFVPERIAQKRSLRLSAGIAFAVTAWGLADGFTAADLGSSLLPLSALGLGWLLPAAAGYIIPLFTKKASAK